VTSERRQAKQRKFALRKAVAQRRVIYVGADGLVELAPDGDVVGDLIRGPAWRSVESPTRPVDRILEDVQALADRAGMASSTREKVTELGRTVVVFLKTTDRMWTRPTVTEEVFPRALSQREAETLRFMLSPEDPRLELLRKQARVVTATGRCSCGCATIGLAVDERRACPAPGLCSPITATRSRVFDLAREPLELILFLDGGWLSGLELVYYAYSGPREFPVSSLFEAPRLSC
jgi:hypothetical protein